MAIENTSIPGSGYGNTYIDALVHGGAGWNINSGPITWYLADADDVRQNGDPGADHYGTWSTTERAAFQAALACYSEVCGLTFQEATDVTTANLVEWQVPTGYIQGLTGNAADGLHEYADGTHGHNNNPNQVWGYYEAEKDYFNYQYAGGAGFYTLIHELGHAMGLSHPFDHKPGQTWFPGADNADSLGDYGLSQFPFTVMSYNQAWSGEPYPVGDFTRGRGGSRGAVDKAAQQRH
jgi:serralysin